MPHLGPIFRTFAPWFSERHPSAVLIVADKNTESSCLDYLTREIPELRNQPVWAMEPGEENKNLATVEALWDFMLKMNLDREALVVLLGGGVVGDLGGFAAATFKRGIPYIQIPTSLVAATDAAIGGKTGVDFQGIKNTIGAFAEAEDVFVDPVFFMTLPRREIRSGLAEVLKHGLIGAPELLNRLEDFPYDPSRADWYRLLGPSIEVKVCIVREDPHEKHLRRLLNFGHTVGHALESFFLTSETPLTHGEAVSIGLVAESFLAWGENLRTGEVVHHVRHFFPPPPSFIGAFDQLWDLMLHDKKNINGQVRIAVPGDHPYSLQILEPTREAFQESINFAETVLK